MRYSCDEIEYLLNHQDHIPDDVDSFLSHIKSCARCAELVDIDSELEQMLILSANSSSSISSEKYILSRIRKYEQSCSRAKKLDKLFVPVIGFFTILPVFLVVTYFEDIKSFMGSINPGEFYNSLLSLVSELRIPDIDIGGIAAAISNSPFIFLTLISVTAILWTFSLIEAQKALK